MDVHDVGNYKVDGNWRALEEGMVLTVEPGIYILDSMKEVDPKWLGIGIRIEDDVVVTKNGNEILTSGVPREIKHIEALMLSS
jgi:Xaa-Pro aminopeptidase